MPIEIRELIIKTEIRSHLNHNKTIGDRKDLQFIKKQVLDECQKMIEKNSKKKNYTR